MQFLFRQLRAHNTQHECALHPGLFLCGHYKGDTRLHAVTPINTTRRQLILATQRPTDHHLKTWTLATAPRVSYTDCLVVFVLCDGRGGRYATRNIFVILSCLVCCVCSWNLQLRYIMHLRKLLLHHMQEK